MNALSLDDRLPIYQQLHDILSQSIETKEWLPGEAIPTESQLMKKYNVSIGTVRKAIDLLVAEGLLERFQGKGTYVRRPKFNTSLFRFFRFQGINGEQIIPESIITNRRLEQATEQVRKKLSLPEHSLVVHLSRLRLINENVVLAEEIWLPFGKFASLIDLPLDQFGLLLYPLYEEQCQQYISHADESLTAEIIDKENAKLLNISKNSPVIVIERIAYSYNKQPLEWRISRGSAKDFRYYTEIR